MSRPILRFVRVTCLLSVLIVGCSPSSSHNESGGQDSTRVQFEAIRLNPKSYSAFGNRARDYFVLGNHAQARKDLALALSLDPPVEDRIALELFAAELDETVPVKTQERKLAH